MKQIITFLTIALLITACSDSKTKPVNKKPVKKEIEKQRFQKETVNINFDSLPYRTISEYGFFNKATNAMIPNEGVMPYDLISPLFTDYASKKRFVWMPNGQSATIVKDDEVLDFPDQTVLIKHFYYEKESYRDQYIVETRLLIKNKGTWMAYPYLWNEAQTEAKYKPTGANVPLSFNKNGIKRTIDYIVPNKNQCKNCHNVNDKFMPIGPKPMHLNRVFSYNGISKNQLSAWSEVGYLSKLDINKKYKKLVNWEDEKENLSARARSYLDINCAHCHNENGSGNTSGLFLNYLEDDNSVLGICKTPVAAGRGSGGNKYDIVPGHPEQSILHFRMNSTEPDIMMPELGRISKHEEGIELIGEWIRGLEGGCQ